MTCPDCASERESRLRAERERDEARVELASFTGGPKCAGVDWHFKTADALATAEWERDEARAALTPILAHYDESNRCTVPGDYGPTIYELEAARAALSPSVTTGGQEAGEELRRRVFEALGAASMCWTETPRGIFESDRAKRIGDDLVAWLVSCPPRAAPPEPSEGA